MASSIQDDIQVCIQGVSRSFREGDQLHSVLKNLNAEFIRGETVALKGRSGSGKSTLLNIISGIDQPDSGRVEVAGLDITAMSERDRTLFRREQHAGHRFGDDFPENDPAETGNGAVVVHHKESQKPFSGGLAYLVGESHIVWNGDQEAQGGNFNDREENCASRQNNQVIYYEREEPRQESRVLGGFTDALLVSAAIGTEFHTLPDPGPAPRAGQGGGRLWPRAGEPAGKTDGVLFALPVRFNGRAKRTGPC